MSTTTDEYTDTQEILHAAVGGPLSLILLVITLSHAYKVYQDLFTADRKSLNHRRRKPKIDHDYKRITYLTLTTIASYCLSLLLYAMPTNFSRGRCLVIIAAISQFWFYVGKCGLYLTYILRLHQVYGPSAYGYPIRNMKCLAVTVVVIIILLFIAFEFAIFSEGVRFDDSDDVFPYYCSINLGPKFLVIMAPIVSLFDIVAAVASIFGFIIPLNKVVKSTQQSTKDVLNEGRNAKILYSGYKYKVLVISASASTLLWIVLFIVGLMETGMVFFTLDYLVNSVCLILMTPYYASNVYYERLCILCILCCDPKRESYQSRAGLKRDSQRSSVVKSLDTSQVLKVHGRGASEIAETKVASDADKDITPAPPDDKDIEIVITPQEQTDMVNAYDADKDIEIVTAPQEQTETVNATDDP